MREDRPRPRIDPTATGTRTHDDPPRGDKSSDSTRSVAVATRWVDDEWQPVDCRELDAWGGTPKRHRDEADRERLFQSGGSFGGKEGASRAPISGVPDA